MVLQPTAPKIDVIIEDDYFPKSELIQSFLEIDSHKVTVEKLISERVRAECDMRLVDQAGKLAPHLIERTVKEQELNDQARSTILAAPNKNTLHEKEITRALHAFEKHSFFVLVNDEQVDSLKQVVEIKENTVVRFLRLTPLQGG